MSPINSPRFAASPPSTPGAPRLRTIPLPELDVWAMDIPPSLAGMRFPVDCEPPRRFRRSPTPLHVLKSSESPTVANRQNPVERHSTLLSHRTFSIDPPHAATPPITHGSGDLSPLEIVFLRQLTENRDEDFPPLVEGHDDGVSGAHAEFCPHCAVVKHQVTDPRELASWR